MGAAGVIRGEGPGGRVGQRREEGVPGAGRRAQVSVGGKAARRRVPAEAALPWVWVWVWGGSAEGGERAARVPPPGTLGETLLSEPFDKRDATGTRSQRWKSPGTTRGSSPGSLPGHAAASHGAPAPLSFPRPPTRAFCSGHAGRAGRCLRRASATGRGPRGRAAVPPLPQVSPAREQGRRRLRCPRSFGTQPGRSARPLARMVLVLMLRIWTLKPTSEAPEVSGGAGGNER